MRTSSSSFLLIGACAAALICGLKVPAAATPARVWSHGVMNNFIADGSNRWLYPHALAKYGDFTGYDMEAGVSQPIARVDSVWFVSHAKFAETATGPELDATVGVTVEMPGNRYVSFVTDLGALSAYTEGTGPPPAPLVPVIGPALITPELRPPGVYKDLNLFGAAGATPEDTRLVWSIADSLRVTQALGYADKNGVSKLVGLGDAVPPRAEPPPPGGNTITGLSSARINNTYAAFVASGVGFTGAYTRKLSDGSLHAVAENFPGSDQYGAIGSVALHGDAHVLFSGRGIWRGHAEGAVAPVQIVAPALEFAPGRVFISGTVQDVEGDLAAVEGYVQEAVTRKVLLWLDLGSNRMDVAVRTGDPIPGPGGGTFAVVQRPAISQKMMVFEGFDQNFTFAGLFGAFNGALFPIARIGGTFDNKTVQAVSFQPSALSGGFVGFDVRFTDATSGTYLAAFQPVITLDSIRMLPDNAVELSGTGLPGSLQPILATDTLGTPFTHIGSARVGNDGKFVHTEFWVGQRFYRRSYVALQDYFFFDKLALPPLHVHRVVLRQ